LHQRLIYALLFFVGLLPSYQPADSSPEIQVLDPQVTYTFGEEVVFEATIQSDSYIESAALFIQQESSTNAIVQPSTIGPFGKITTILDLSQSALRAFSQVSYWYQITLENGNTHISDPFTFFFEDNNFEWEVLESNRFHIHWYEDDLTFAQTVLNSANEGLERIRSFLQVPEPKGIDIYVYANAMDLQKTVMTSGQAWISGHADPDLGVIVVSLPPGPARVFETKRQIPHELMHVMLYETLGPSYRNLPKWLNEGLASISELSPNPDYQLLLNHAYENESLIALSELCASFPVDASNFLLSYAESASFTWYLHQHYGNAGLEALLSEYDNGVGCERGIENALGDSLSNLEQDWRRAIFNENALLSALINILPWFIVVIVSMGVPLGLTLIGGRKKE
jgi:hypothetical protein